MLVKNINYCDIDPRSSCTLVLLPHLEFASSVWNPNRQKDISDYLRYNFLLRQVQRRASKIPITDLQYEERLKI